MIRSVLLTAFLWASTHPTPPSSHPSPSMPPSRRAAPTAEEKAFVALVNAERTRRGLNALALDPLLSETARAHSAEMRARRYFDHRSPTPGLASPIDRYLHTLTDEGKNPTGSLLVAENIYYGGVPSRTHGVTDAHRALMASPGHRANILQSRFTRVGLGVCHSAQGEVWVTEMFVRDTNPR